MATGSGVTRCPLCQRALGGAAPGPGAAVDSQWGVCATERQYRDRMAPGPRPPADFRYVHRGEESVMVRDSAWFSGLDLAAETHHVCVDSDDGSKRQERTFRYGGKDLNGSPPNTVAMSPRSPSISRTRQWWRA